MLDLSSQLLLTDARLENEAMVNRVVSRARKQLSQHDYFRSYSDLISIDYQEGRLVLKGRLPSFYLKQVLQTVLRGQPGVRRVDNRVDVISSTGLSSTRNSYCRSQLI